MGLFHHKPQDTDTDLVCEGTVRGQELHIPPGQAEPLHSHLQLEGEISFLHLIHFHNS